HRRSAEPSPDLVHHLGGDSRIALLNSRRQASAGRPERPRARHPRPDPDKGFRGRPCGSDPPGVGDDEMSGAESSSKRQRNGIADAAVDQRSLSTSGGNLNRGKQSRNRGTGPDDVGEGHAVAITRRVVTRLAGGDVMTGDAETPDALVQPLEARRFELLQAMRNDSAQGPQRLAESLVETHAEAVSQQLTSTKRPRIGNQVVDVHPYSCVVTSDYCACAHANNHVERDGGAEQVAQYTEV